MRRRPSIRATTAAVLLLLATTASGAVNATSAPAAPGHVTGQSTSHLHEKSSKDHLKKHPATHGDMANATNRRTSGPLPRLSDPLTKAGLGATAAPGRGPATASVLAPPVQATATTDPPIGHPGFDGLSKSSGPDTNGEPPDPWLAVGPEHVMQVVNSSFRITDRQGIETEDPTAFAGFVDSFGFTTLDQAVWFDPHVIYDSLHGRWLLTMDGIDCVSGVDSTFGHGYLFIATSDTIDPTGFWTGTYFLGTDLLIDYTAPGTSTDKFAVASNLFSMTDAGSCLSPSFAGTDVTVIDWADWLDSNPDYSTDGVSGDTSSFDPRVAVQSPATSSRLHVVGEVAGAGPGADVEYFSLTGTANTNISIESDVDLTTGGVIDQFLPPPAPNQPGPNTIANAVDSRPTDAIWQNNLLTFVSTRPCTPTGDSTIRDCVRVSQLDTTGVSSVVSPTLAQDFLVAENGKDSYMGGVGMAGNGTLHVVWSRSSASAGDFPSSYAAYQLPSEAANSISPKELLKAGTGVYTGERWGDYVGVAQDPLVPSAVWQANQYSGTGAEWKTWISRLQPAGTTYVPVTPVRVLDTRPGPGQIGPSGKFTAKVARTWQVTGVGGIPAGAVAVTGNVTVTQQEAVGFVAVTPTATNTPSSSTINIPLNDNRANNLTVPLSSTGTLSATYGAATGKKTHLIFDVTGYFLADDTGATFSPLAPVRVLDTRGPTPIGLSGTFANSVPRTLTIAGTNGVPLSATAITGNLTVTQQSAAGYLAITRDPTADPATSTLNFPVSDNRANGVFAPLDGSGALSIVYKATAGAHTHVILDVTGYFVPGTAGLRFVPLNPGRIMDTRPGAVLSGRTGVFHAGAARALPVAGHWGVPDGAQAFTGNLTVTAQTGVGYIAVSPAQPVGVPATSTLNFPLGDNRANGLVSPLGTGPSLGQTWLVYIGATGKTTQLILDLSGYFE